MLELNVSGYNNDDNGKDKIRKKKYYLFWLEVQWIEESVMAVSEFLILLFCLFGSAERTSHNKFRACVFCSAFGLAVKANELIKSALQWIPNCVPVFCSLASAT